LLAAGADGGAPAAQLETEHVVHLRPVVTHAADDRPDASAEVYIDAVSLTPGTPGYRPRTDAAGEVVRNDQGEQTTGIASSCTAVACRVASPSRLS
jgi:hypothetical protein